MHKYTQNVYNTFNVDLALERPKDYILLGCRPHFIIFFLFFLIDIDGREKSACVTEENFS